MVRSLCVPAARFPCLPLSGSVFNYLQKMTSTISLGGEMMYQYGGGSEHSGLSFGGR